MNLLCLSSNQYKHLFFSEKLNQSIVDSDCMYDSAAGLNAYLEEKLGLSTCNLLELNYCKFFKKLFNGNVYTLKNLGKFRVEYINSHFDYVVISLADPFTTKNLKFLNSFYTEFFIEFIENLKIPFVFVDFCIESKEFLSSNYCTMVKITQLLKKALAITTVDEDSQKYLLDFGIKEVVCLGYLGFYLNHRNVYKSIGALNNIKYSNVATSSVCALNNKYEIAKLGKDFIKELIRKNNLKDITIIFKDELFALDLAKWDSINDIYDEENSKFNDIFIHKIKERNTLDVSLNFTIYLFLNLQLWQEALTKFDVFISNFFKTSVIAMQSGIPVLFVDPEKRFIRYLNKFEIPFFQTIPIINSVKIPIDKIKNIQNKYLSSYEYAKNYFKKTFKIVDSKVLVLQNSNYTSRNRYPDIFSYFSDNHINDQKKVLSFGCSVGDEVFSLDSYFKNSIIVGIDISDEMVNIAKERATEYQTKNNNEICFYTAEDLRKHNKICFDVIFAMSVLCKWGGSENTANKENISMLFPYDTYLKTITEIDDLLNINGYLVIYNANYSFEDTSVYEKYSKLIMKKESSKINYGFVQRYKVDGSVDNRIDLGTIFIKKSNIFRNNK